MSAALPTIKPGDIVLERYRVIEQIASGGHSVVYRGQDERLSRPVCIKVFSGLGGESGVGRTSYEHFVQEAFALSRLTHPNTLRIYDFGHLGSKDSAGMPLQICEYMNGGTLSELVRGEGKLALPEAAAIVTAMCAALGEAHALGIVHRDIKPQNILFGTAAGRRLPKLADFGIAKWSTDAGPEPADAGDEPQRRAQDTQIVAGQKLAMYSPSWAAPEQLSGQAVSAATDIYSLAVVAVYMLSQKAIFADEDVYAGYKKRRHAAALLTETLAPAGIAASVIAVLERALAFDPKRRLSHVDELATELAAVMESLAAPAHEADPAPEPEDDARARRAVPVRMATQPTEPMFRPEPPATLPTGTGPGVIAPDPAELTPPPMPPIQIAPMPPPPAPQPPPQQLPGYTSAPTLPWMSTSPAPIGTPQRLVLGDLAITVGDRRVRFVMPTNDVADLVDGHLNKVRVTLLPGPDGRVVHLKGMSCFIAPLGGRPSPAVHLTSGADLALVTPRAQEIGHIRVATALSSGADHVFALGAQLVAIAVDDCADPILFDFGPGSDAYFVYTRGRPLPKSSRRG